MAPTLGERLGRERVRRFVGRETELAHFDDLLDAQDEAAVVVVHGPAGIGKSTLVRQFAHHARERGPVPLQIDARDLPPTAEALAYALSPALHGTIEGRAVVLIDAYELLAGVDRTLSEHLAPQFPDNTVLVMSGQHGPSTAWRGDEGWGSLLHSFRLNPLSATECTKYLEDRGVPTELQAAAVDFAHGHPLALALVGEVVRQQGNLAPTASADVVRVLIDRLLAEVPGPDHRAAVDAAALVRVIDEPLLATLLDRPDCSDLFAWLRALPFVDGGRGGLFLHDLAREVLTSDLRWRHQPRFVSMHDRARDHYLGRLETADPVAQATALLDLIFLHPDLRPFLQAPDESAALQVDVLRPDDVPAIVAMITEHEGPESGEFARHWLTAAPRSWSVVRSAASVEGTFCFLDLASLTGADNDPAVAAARAELDQHAPLRPGERATLIRFWLSRVDYQNVSPVQSIIATQFARHFLTTAGLALTVLPFAVPEDWVAFCAYADQRRAPDADFSVGGRRYTSFVHDWRTAPPAAWVARMSVQQVGGPVVEPEPGTDAPVLSRTDFGVAVRQALRDFPRPDRLRSSALLTTRMMDAARRQTSGDDVEMLRSLLREAIETLTVVEADRRLHRVLVRAYLKPAPTLERAAEVLELPSSTFRRLLSTAVDRVTTVLWHRELES